MSFRNEQRDVKDWYKSVLARLDDLERQRPCDCVCNCCDQPNIWTVASLTPGDTTWTSACGDERLLFDEIARGISEPGLAYGARQATSVLTFLAGDLNADYPAGELAILDIDVTTSWTYDVGHYEDHYQLSMQQSGGAQPWVLQQTGGNDHLVKNVGPFPSPSSLGISDAIVGLGWPDEFQCFVADPGTAGLTGFRRGILRLTQDPSTGDVGILLGPNTASLTDRGTISTTRTGQGGLRMSFRQGGTSRGEGVDPPLRAQRDVLHGVRAWTPTSGTIYEVTQADIIALGQTYVFETYLWDHLLIGGAQISSNTTVTPNPASQFRFAPISYGSPPLYFNTHRQRYYEHDWVNPHANLTPPVSPVFNSGDALTDPVMAVSKYYTPTEITVVEADPFTYQGIDDTWDHSYYLWAVADRATFDVADIDANGWPTDWYPFGTLGT